MKKQLVAAAIAAAVAAPAAYAEVTIYGKLHLSIDSVDEDGVGGYDGQTITDRDSRIGFKGSEDLGNGMKAVFKTEWTFDMDGENTAVSNSRNNYLGLATEFGTFLLAGNINHPYKSAFGKYDFFADTLADWDNTIGMDDNRADNAIVYISPAFAGLKLMAASVAAENAAKDWTSLASFYSLALTYTGGGLMAAIAYEDVPEDADTITENIRVGAGYKFGAFGIAAAYEQQDKTNEPDVDRWTIQGSFAMGNNKLKAMYGNVDDVVDSDAWAIGVDHMFSKRTSAYVVYADSEYGLRAQSEGNYGAGSGFSLGMVHKF